MNEYSFMVNGVSGFPPELTFHLPLEAKLVLSDAAVASGIATGSDIISISIAAGDALPEGSLINFGNLGPTFLKPTAILSPDRKTVTAISSESPKGWKWDFWPLFQTFHETPAGKVENTVRIYADQVEVETDYIPPITPEVYDSVFTGVWMREKEKLPSRQVHELAIDPLALILPNDIYIKLHLPDPPPFEAVQEYIRRSLEAMSAEEYERTYARFKKMKGFTDSLEKLFQSRR
jgi:hypothetical protein